MTEALACDAYMRFVVDGREGAPVGCTLPEGHEDWHEHATPEGVVIWTWAGYRDLGSRPYPERLAGPHLTERLGRLEPRPIR